MTRSQAAVAGLQECLALEHEALWNYAYLGARVPASDAAAQRAFGAHRDSRDILMAMLQSSASDQPAPLAAYDVDTIKNLAQAATLARHLEDKSSVGYLQLVGASEGEDREFAITMLRKAALAILVWGGKPAAFPGLQDLVTS